MIQIKHLRVLGVFLEGNGEGVDGIDASAGGRAEEDAHGSFACAAGYAVVVVCGGEEDEGMDCHVDYGVGCWGGVVRWCLPLSLLVPWLLLLERSGWICAEAESTLQMLLLQLDTSGIRLIVHFERELTFHNGSF
jgi:hypothetical protein